MTERMTTTSPEWAPPGSTLLLLTQGGSRAYGTTGPDGGDEDYVAITVETAGEVFALGQASQRSESRRSQPVGTPSKIGDRDLVIHPLRRWLSLAAKGNPNSLESLWAPVVTSSWMGIDLRTRSEWFVGRHLITPYLGYMEGQERRFLAGEAKGPRAAVAELHGYDTKAGMHTARLGFQCLELLTTRQLSFPIAGEPGMWLREVRHGRVPFAEWQSRCATLRTMIRSLEDDETIPATSDRDSILAWSIDAHRTWWGRGV